MSVRASASSACARRSRRRCSSPSRSTSLWLTGLDSSNAALLVEPDRLRIFTDFRYLEKARATGAEVVEIPRGLFSELPELLPKRVAFESESLVHASWAALDAAGIETVPTAQLVEGVRAVKEPGELDAIRRAAAITNECFDRLAEQPFVGRTETRAGLVDRVDDARARRRGCRVPADRRRPERTARCRTRARAHGRSSRARPSSSTPPRRSTATTRTARGRSRPARCRTSSRAPTTVCLEAQLAGLEATRAGRSGRDVDAVARDVIAEAGLGELFAHGLGHGVGMEIHEQPAMRPESEDVLAVDGVVTVEPGIYHPGLGGIRIEDLVIIGENEPEVLTTFTKELVTVGR